MATQILPLLKPALDDLVNNDYLSTDHMSKFNEILAAHTDFRPQEVLLMWNLTDKIIPIPRYNRHIQILPSAATVQVTHWICTYYDGTLIHIYDSLNGNRNFNITDEQLRFLYGLFPHKPAIVYENVQQQQNGTDCGVFAIAFAVSIALQLNPSHQRFNISLMRNHLKLIFEQRQLFPFPTEGNSTEPTRKCGRPIKIKRGRPAVHNNEASKKCSQRSAETPEQTEERLAKNRDRNFLNRATESDGEKAARLKEMRCTARNKRSNESEETRNKRLEEMRCSARAKRLNESEEERSNRLEEMRHTAQSKQLNETEEERNDRLDKMRLSAKRRRVNESSEAKAVRLEHVRHKVMSLRQISWKNKENSAFKYNACILYDTDSDIVIGSMSTICCHCKALRWKSESRGLCCNNGKVRLELLRTPPEPLKSLLNGTDVRSKMFLSSVKNYNNAFQMTSFGATKIVAEGNYMPTFKIQGQVYHLVGSLLPDTNEQPKFLQLYFMGDDNKETTLRCNNYSNLDFKLVQDLQKMLHSSNSYVKSFKTTLEKQIADKDFKVIIHADKRPFQSHKGRYNAPVDNEVAVLIVGQDFQKRDIILHSKTNHLQRISEIHRSYDALQYPLMFPYGEDGYHTTVEQFNSPKTVSCMSFYAYRLMARENEINYLHYFRQLYNQYLVDMYAKIETERLSFIRNNQKKLRVDDYIHLRDAINSDRDIQNLGQLVILPSSFTGSPRYMHEKTQDAMTYVRKFGRPDLFITFTTNPKWQEITNVLLQGQLAQDRHDIVSRVFHLKVKCLMNLLVKGKIFGAVICYMYSIEWQKRGLPHVHILLWLEKKITPNQIDSILSAEFPNKQQDPELFSIIKSNMIHGPCGLLNPKSPCMKDGKCSKRYPKAFVNETRTGDDGYPTYRRRSPDEGGNVAEIKIGNTEMTVDNRWVVPYCPLLSKTFNAHINIEFCNSVKSIKYICKYVNKGSDQATFTIVNKQNDEIYQYQTGRYVSSSEATWRIFSFPIHERYPSVVHLAVHLENGQRVYFTVDNVSERISEPPTSTLLAFFQLCSEDAFAKTLFYNEVPSYYTWNGKTFQRRKQGSLVQGFPEIRKSSALGRVYTVHPNNAECYYLRLLLHNVKGPTSFNHLKQVDGKQYPTFLAACQALGLLEDDSHWDKTLQEAVLTDSPNMLRDLFVILLAFCNLSDPNEMWHKYKNSLTEDIYRRQQAVNPALNPIYTDDMYNQVLIILEDKLQSLCGKTLKDYGLPMPQRHNVPPTTEYNRETSYDVNRLKDYVNKNEMLLVKEQKTIYDEILESIDRNQGKIYFLDAPGGTGKTFLINLILAKIRSQQNIAIAVASSGIAATLMEGGKTAHSSFKLPLNLTYSEAPVCNVKKGTPLAQLLIDCKIIIWDECTMSHKRGVEALHRTLMDIRNNNSVMGGVTVLFSGDFRQTLPVIPRGTRADEINASLKSSYLWNKIHKLTLTVNMRVHLKGDGLANEFSRLLLQIGNGELEENLNKEIKIPNIIGKIVKSVEELMNEVYPDVSNLKEKPDSWLCERAILSPRNDAADEINKYLLKKFTSNEKTYFSVDTVLEQSQAVHFPVEFLNSLNPPGMAPHLLILKIGTPIMLLRNLNAPKLCNGTRLRITSLQANTIEASILTGCAKGEKVLIPRIPMIPSDYPFEFKRVQFPIKVCFALTINKAQGQTLSIAGIDLRTPCFSHGQFYVACSRVSQKNNLYILTPTGYTKNIVYKEALL